MPLSREVAAYTRALSLDDLDAAAVDQAERVVLDTVGCAVGAVGCEPATILQDVYGDRRSATGARVIGSSDRLPVEYAALTNGLLGRYLDFNDIYAAAESVCHPSDHIPGLLSVAEAEGASGREILEAVVIAYEVECRGVDTGRCWPNGFDYVTWGATSSAAAAGRLMDLTEDELVHAIGIAAASSNALLVSRMGEVSMWKAMAHPYVTHNAIQACQLARAGMTGPEKVFEGVEERGGEGGFFHAVSGSTFDFGDLGSGDPKVLDAILKRYACAYFAHPAVYGVRSIMDEHGLASDDVAAIEVSVFDHAMQVYATPEKWARDMNRETADHSLPYNVAIAAIDGEVTPRQYETDRLRDDRVHDLMARIEVHGDESLDEHRHAHPRHVPERVTVTTTGGDTHERRVNAPPGHPENPLPDDVIDDKVRGLAAASLTDVQTERLIDACRSLRELDTVDVILDAAEG